MRLKDGKLELFDFSTGWRVLTDYVDCRMYSDDLSAVAIRAAPERSQWGYIDRWGKLCIQCGFDIGANFRGGRALVIRGDVPQIIDTTGAIISETLWAVGDDAASATISARQGCIMVTIVDTLSGEAVRRDCGPVSLAFRPVLLIGSADHCHIRVPSLPPVAAVLSEVPNEEVLCGALRVSITCDAPHFGDGMFLWEQEQFSIDLELSDDEYAILQKGHRGDFLRTSWRMEADELWLWRGEDFARVSFHRTGSGWSSWRGWTNRKRRSYCETHIVPLLKAAVGRRPQTFDQDSPVHSDPRGG